MQTIHFQTLMSIYLYGPHFIKEQNISKIAESKTILKCYGILPGGMKDPTNILYGIPTYWYNNIYLNNDAVDKDRVAKQSIIKSIHKI